MTMPTVATPRAWSFPAHRSIVLDNGLTVWAIHVPGQYVISAEVVFDVPLSIERRDREGIAAMCVRTMGDATRRHDSREFADLVEGTGASLYTLVQHGGLVLGMSVPATRLQDGLGLLASAVLEPAFSEADVARNVDQRLGEIRNTMAGSRLAGVLFAESVFSTDTRAARMTGGGPDSVSVLTTEDVSAFYREHLGPANTTLILTGDLGAMPIEKAAEHFGGWRGSAVRQPHQAAAPADPTAVICHREGAVQADVRFGGFGVDRHEPRWADVNVACHALGGGMVSRLNQRLREELGYTYGVDLALMPQRRGGAYAVSGSFRTEVAAAALAEVRTLLDVQTFPLTAEAVDEAVRGMTLSAVSTHVTAGSIAGEAAYRVLGGQAPDAIDAELTAVRTVTAESATAAAADLIGSGPHTLVVVGDAAQLAPQLKSAGFTVSVRDPDIEG